MTINQPFYNLQGKKNNDNVFTTGRGEIDRVPGDP